MGCAGMADETSQQALASDLSVLSCPRLRSVKHAYPPFPRLRRGGLGGWRSSDRLDAHEGAYLSHLNEIAYIY
jgi:hypothetical protein